MINPRHKYRMLKRDALSACNLKSLEYTEKDGRKYLRQIELDTNINPSVIKTAQKQQRSLEKIVSKRRRLLR